MSAPRFLRNSNKPLPREQTALLAGDGRLHGRIDGLPGTEPIVLLFPQTDPADLWSGLATPILRDGKKMGEAKRLAFIARSKRIDPGRLAFIQGTKSGPIDWWTKLPPEWGNPQETHRMVHGPAATVPLVVSLLPEDFDGIALYPVSAGEGDQLFGAAILVVAKNAGFVLWREASTLRNAEALAMTRRPLIDRTMEIVLQTGQSAPSENLLWIRDDRNRGLPLWEHLSDPLSEAPTPILDQAIARPPLVYDSPVVRSRRSVAKLKKYGPALFFVILLGVGLWYYENVLLIHDPRTIAALEARRTRLETHLAAVRKTREGLAKIEASLTPRPWIHSLAVLEYLSGGLARRTIEISASEDGQEFVWTLSGEPIKGLTPSEIQSGLTSAANKLAIPVEKTGMKTGEHLDAHMTFSGSIPNKTFPMGISE
jgi:hypothetical protein